MQGRGKLILREIAAPATPAADEAAIYLGAGAPGTVFVKHDDGSVVDLEGGGMLSNVFKSASEWGAVPDTATDMTAEIQAAFDNAPLGCILIFDPGVYEISNTVYLSRTLNVIFDNVTLDLEANTPSTTFSPGIPENHNGVSYLSATAREAGTLANKAAFIWGVSGGNRPTRNWIKGNLHITRTSSDNTAATRLHVGMLMLAPFECSIDFIEVTNYFAGVVLMGGGSGQGCVHNVVDNIKTTNCRYPLTLYSNRATGAGYANQNELRGGRLFHNSTIHGDTSYNASQWEAIRLLWESGGTSPAPPNGNKFGPITIETEWGRKIRDEGRDNEFGMLRYEDVHQSQTIQILNDTDVDNSPTTRWSVTGGVAVTTLATCTADGTLTQAAADFANAITASTSYKLTYDAVSTGFTGSLALSGICNSLAGLPITTGSHEVTFSTKASPTDLILTFVRTAGTLTVDNISLVAQADITIGEVSRTNSNFSRNLFFGGENLSNIVALDSVEYLSSGGGNGLNNANTFICGKSNLYAARVDAGDAHTTAHRFITTGSTAAVLSAGSSTDIELVRLYHVFASLAAQGTLEFLDTGGVQRNAIGMNTASPYDFRTLAGLNIANVFRVRIDGTIDAILANPQTGGMILIPVATGLIKAWASSNTSDVLTIADSNRDARLTMKAQETVGATTYLDAILFYDDDATPTLKNVIGIHASSDLPGGSGSRPLMIKWGIDANEQEEDADSRIRGANVTNLFYVDASTDRVGINTNTPDSQFHVAGKIHGTDELELDGVLNHDGASVGFFGTAPAGQPTVTGSRGGNAALASLLTALAGLGLIVDSTTA